MLAWVTYKQLNTVSPYVQGFLRSVKHRRVKNRPLRCAMSSSSRWRIFVMDENSIYLLRERMETHACILFSWKSHKEKARMSEALSKHSKCFGFATLMCWTLLLAALAVWKDRTLNQHWWTSRLDSGVERTTLKELGKLFPYLRNKGSRSRWHKNGGDDFLLKN
jgi:hypothetical protein